MCTSVLSQKDCGGNRHELFQASRTQPETDTNLETQLEPIVQDSSEVSAVLVAKGAKLMFRPQFPYPTPPGYDDGDFDQYFDYRNVVALNNTALPAANYIWNVPLNLQSDQPFLVRGIQVKGMNAADPVVSAQFRDPFGNYLSDQFVPLDLSVSPEGTALYFLNIILEPMIACPKGSVFWMNLYNQTTGSQDITKVRVTLSGVKRYVAKERRCAA
jgi:hypothetical protein